ncbi:hypothetical protein F5051DRAFT_311236, partial [Lentinula edodes]
WEELGFKVNREQEMMMRTADGSTAPLEGCAEYLEIMVDGLRTWAHAFIVPSGPFRVLLGRPWQKLVQLAKVETDEAVTVTIHDP